MKLLNPFIILLNFFRYTAHLENFRYHQDKYKPYDYSKDIKCYKNWFDLKRIKR